jgi:hypothetical protein
MFRDKEYTILIKCRKKQLKELLDLGYINKTTLIEHQQRNDKCESNFKEIFLIEEFKNLFSNSSMKSDVPSEGIKHLKNKCDILLKMIQESLTNTSLELPKKLLIALDEYLQDSIYIVYLTTGFTEDGKPAFLILIENESTPLRLDCSVLIDTSNWKEKDFDKWPDMDKKTAQIWKMNKE